MGIWIRSQDGAALSYCKTITAWKNGRVVNTLGKEYIHLGDYGSERAKEVILDIARHIMTGTVEVYEMPKI